MARVGLFLARFLLGLWIALSCAFAFLLLFNAPTVPTAPFSSVAIAASPKIVYLPTRSFDCTETDRQFQCETAIRNRPLVLTWQKGGELQDGTYRPYPKDCEATYDGRAVGCRNQGMSSVIGSPDQYEVTDLGLSPRQIRGVQQRYWGVNTLERLGEPSLMKIGYGLALLGGISTACACFVWIQRGPLSSLFVSIACGFGAYLFLLSLNFLRSLLFAAPGTSEALPDWIYVTQGGAMIGGVIAMLLVALTFQRGRAYLPKAIASLVSGIGTAAVLSYLTLFMLLWLRYAD